VKVEPWLSRDQRKREFYSEDPYFWEGLASFHAALSRQPAAHGQPAEAALRPLTFLLVKPEAIAGRRITPMLDYLHARGFCVIGTWPLRLGRHAVRALWQYQLNAVPVAHIRALEMIVGAGQPYLIGLCRPPDGSRLGAAELLSRCKGSSADPPGGGSLRDALGRPALMLNFVHAPDEPADLLRELAVLCEPPLQQQILAAMLAAPQWPAARFCAAVAAARQVMTAQYARCPAHDLDATATLRRMRAMLGEGQAARLSPAACAAIERGSVSPERALEVVSSLDAARDCAAWEGAALESATWDGTTQVSATRDRAAGLPQWDLIVTAVALADGLRTGQHPLIGPPPAPQWEQHGDG
jgi:hypothetical protein